MLVEPPLLLCGGQRTVHAGECVLRPLRRRCVSSVCTYYALCAGSTANYFFAAEPGSARAARRRRSPAAAGTPPAAAGDGDAPPKARRKLQRRCRPPSPVMVVQYDEDPPLSRRVTPYARRPRIELLRSVQVVGTGRPAPPPRGTSSRGYGRGGGRSRRARCGGRPGASTRGTAAGRSRRGPSPVPRRSGAPRACPRICRTSTASGAPGERVGDPRQTSPRSGGVPERPGKLGEETAERAGLEERVIPRRNLSASATGRRLPRA